MPLPAPSLTLPRKRGRGRRSREIGASLASIILLLFFVAAALALTFPPLTGRVVDDANILDPAQRAALTQKLADLEAKITDQVVVVTLKSLQGYIDRRLRLSARPPLAASARRTRTTACC